MHRIRISVPRLELHANLLTRTRAVISFKKIRRTKIRIGFLHRCRGVAYPYTDGAEDIELLERIYFSFTIRWITGPGISHGFRIRSFKVIIRKEDWKNSKYLPEIPLMQPFTSLSGFLDKHMCSALYVRSSETANRSLWTGNQDFKDGVQLVGNTQAFYYGIKF